MQWFKYLFLALIAWFLNGCSAFLYETVVSIERNRGELVKKEVQLSFGTINYLDNEQNSSETIIFLHGFNGDKDNWNRFIAKLTLPYRMIAPDLPGQGNNVPAIDLNYTTTHQAHMVHEFIQALSLASPVHLVANSMGGAIAVRLSQIEEIQSMALFDPLGVMEHESRFETMLRQEGINPLLGICNARDFERFVHLSMHRPPYIPRCFMSHLAQKKCDRQAVDEKIFWEMLSDANIKAHLSQLSMPTLIVWGAHDAVLDVGNAQIFNENIPNSTLIILKDLGHVPLIEDPKQSATIYQNFIEGIFRLQ